MSSDPPLARPQPGAASAEGLIGLYNNPAVNRMVEFAAVANTLASDVGMLARCYDHLVRVAPRRHARGKRYVHGRTGTTSSGASSNRREEHLAVALCNASRSGVAFALPDRRPFAIIDYQMPLKARQGDLGVGKVDLFAVVDGRLPCVIELKVAGESARGDTPLRALLEGLAYCAIVEANAAEQGLASAQNNLGVMYNNGEGVPQDNVEAHMWLNLAASRSSGADREQTVATRDRVAERMTPADLSEAQRRAREWHAAHQVP